MKRPRLRRQPVGFGVFLTVDPLLDTSNPQQANGYSYANNNPVSMSDPSGAEPHDNACDGLSGANATACHNYSYGSGPMPAGGYDSGGVCVTDSQCMRSTSYGSPGAPVSAKKVTDYSKPVPAGDHISWGSDGQALLVPNGMHPEGPNYVLVFDPPPAAGPGPVSDINYCGPVAIICDILPINAVINCGAHPSGEGCLDAAGQTALTGTAAAKGLQGLKALAAARAAGEASPSVIDLLMPGGSAIGKAGSDASIREITGGMADAETMFQSLSQGGTEVANTPALTRVQLPNGGFVQLRTVMSRSPGTIATIDVNIPGVDITKLKYNP